MTNASTKQKEKDSLGKLKTFGLREDWHVALMLPVGWDDLTQIIDSFDVNIKHGTPCVIKGRLVDLPTTKFDAGKPPRLVGNIQDAAGRKVRFSLFGDSRLFVADLKEDRERVFLYGRVETFNGEYWLKSPEVVQPKWIDHYRPRYAGKTGVINPDTVRDRVLRSLRKAIPIAAEFLAEELKDFGNRERLAQLAGLPGWPLETILLQAHAPISPEYGMLAQRALENLASLGILREARCSVAEKPAEVLKLGDWKKRAGQIPYKLTDEQERAVVDALADMSSGSVMHRLLVADVGFGKSSVLGTIAATVVDRGGRVVVLLPNESLAGQIAHEFGSWWPDLNIQLVTGSSKEGKVTGSLVVGTTALLFRDIGKVDLVQVDEQQKFSREQREQLVGAGTHLYESTATCIPRSLALARYGVVKVSKLTKPHTPKTIHTRIWHAGQVKELGVKVKRMIASGGQVLYVYPLRETEPKEGEEGFEAGLETAGQGGGAKRGPMNELTSATDIYVKWEKILPGKVRLIHGQMSDAEKAAALRDMREGRASVLVSTTVVEVGINLPKLRQVIIVHPERHGLTTLHQIRGRVARLGGEGWCDLYLPYPLKDHSMERLKVLEKTQDGFEVAEHDMRLRGVGDLSRGSSKQSGADETFLFGRPVSVESLDSVMQLLDELGMAG